MFHQQIETIKSIELIVSCSEKCSVLCQVLISQDWSQPSAKVRRIILNVFLFQPHQQDVHLRGPQEVGPHRGGGGARAKGRHLGQTSRAGLRLRGRLREARNCQVTSILTSKMHFVFHANCFKLRRENFKTLVESL